MPLATPTRRMPSINELRELLEGLLGRESEISGRNEFDLDDGTVLWTATYVEEDGTVGGACIVDLDLASYGGAALAMIPKPAAEESINKGELDDGLKENFYEVANIATSLLNNPIVPHLKITEFEAGVPEGVRDLILKASGRTAFTIDISDYGPGGMALYAL